MASSSVRWVSTAGQIGYSTSPEYGGIGVWEYSTTIHVRVGIATGGEDNYFLLSQVTSAGTGAAWGNWASSVCDVTEYNAGFNYKQDGTNDQIVLVNNGGQVVIPA